MMVHRVGRRYPQQQLFALKANGIDVGVGESDGGDTGKDGVGGDLTV